MAAPRMGRRLAAVLSADVAGYARLAGRDEQGTIARLKSIRAAVVQPAIARYGGRVVKLMGDGALIEFGSVFSAVEAAVEMQRGVAERELGHAEGDRIRFRIGINLGDVLVDGDDILGDGVNVAARLEGLAEPGGICVASNVYEQVRDRLAYPFEDLGEQSVKNIARRLHVYLLRPEALASLRAPEAAPADVRPRRHVLKVAAVAAAIVGIVLAGTAWFRSDSWPLLPSPARQGVNDTAPFASTASPRLSIVVLPFTNLGADSEQDYFADGITDDLTTELTRIEGSFVVAPNTARAYRGKAMDAKELGRELGVRYVLEGSLRRMGDRVRINAQLVDATTGGQIWADRFEADWVRSMELQDQITARLARTLDLALTDAEGRRAEAERPTDPDTLDLAMRGWSVLNRPVTKENLEQARPLFERALVIDPELPKAMVGLARTLSAAASAHMSAAPEDDLARADEAVTRVLARLPNHAMAHFVKGEILVTRKQFDAAIDEYRAAIANDHSLAPAYGAIGRALIRAGRAEEAFAPLEAAIRLSPRDPALNIWYFSICHAHSHLAHDEAAVEWCNRAVATGPYWVAYVDLASAYAWQGHDAEAHAAVIKLRELVPGYTVDRWAHEGWSDDPTFLAQYERITAGLRKAGLPET